MTRLGRALISVHDKTGVVEFARGLAALGAEIVSTGGTARLLRESGVPVVDVAEITGFPEMLDGRVKTLHPKVHGGLLARRELPEHMAALERHGIRPIDLVAVTLYPFEQTVAKADVTLEEAIENIDIGGPSMIRGAAKNHAHVAVVTDPAQYGPVLDELRKSHGTLSDETRFRLAAEAFRRTAQYDAAIAAYLRDPAAAGRPAPAGGFPERLAGYAFRSAVYFENDPPRIDRYLVSGQFSLAFSKLHFGRLLCKRHVGEHSDPDFAGLAQSARESLPCRFKLV